jgi:hypothetical protein
MPNSQFPSLARHYRESHRRALALVEGLPDEEVAWRPAPTAYSIGWNLWQMARWADRLQAQVSLVAAGPELSHAPGRLIWDAEGLEARWGFEPGGPGGPALGTLLDSAVLPALPGAGPLLDYARRAFAASEEALEALSDRQTPAQIRLGPEVDADELSVPLAESFMQENRRLGEIESLRRLQEMP